MKKFWSLKKDEQNAKAGDLYFYGEIASSEYFNDDVTPAKLQQDLAGLGDIEELNVHINSPGGDAFAGFAIYNILCRTGLKVNVWVDGLAASAASVIAMAGDKIYMPQNATMMIHNAWSYAEGGADEMRKVADELDRLNGQIAGIYAKRTGMAGDKVAELMDEEKWMSGDEAVELGFADEVIENKAVAASADAGEWLKRYKHAPENLKNAEVQGEKSEPVADKEPPEELIRQKEHFEKTLEKLSKG